MRIGFFAFLALALAACGGTADFTSGASGSGGSATGGSGSSGTTGTTGTTGSTGAAAGSSGGSSGGNLCATQSCVVYASADHDLYQVNPTSLDQTHLCTFAGALSSSDADVVTDIAVAKDGTLYAITETALYTVNPQGCSASKVATLSQSGTRWVGLTFTAQGVLLAADGTGIVVSIDPSSGAVTPAGNFGGGLACSGDLVAIDDANGTIYATATRTSGSGNDELVKLDPTTHAAAVIGSIGYTQVYGLGFWAGKLYGFTHAGQTLLINPASGQASVVGTTSAVFSGGATTPLAPVFE